MRKGWNHLEHQVFHFLKEHGLLEQPLLLAVSGGLDSACLLEALDAVIGSENLEEFSAERASAKSGRAGRKNNFSVMYIHHGDEDIKENFRDVQNYRSRAQVFVETICREKNISFHSAKALPPLRSENEMRDYRYQALRAKAQELGARYILLAHHQEDQAETQLLHLLRGCGVEGLRGMKPLEGDLVRPLLNISKQALRDYAHERSVKYLDDPSNDFQEPLRNWLRQHWLPQLDEKQMGMKQSFFSSLQKITQQIESDFAKGEKAKSGALSIDFSAGLPRAQFMAQTREEKKSTIYHYLRHLGVREMTQGQVEEILKRLDKSQRDLTFNMSHSEWTANAELIKAKKR